MKKLSTLVLVFCLLASCALIGAAGEDAISSAGVTGGVVTEDSGDKPELYLPKQCAVYLNSRRTEYLNGMQKNQISKLKSSKKKVASVALEEWSDGDCGIVITGKKTGTTTISFDLKVNGKTYHYEFVAMVKKYESPFQSIKIGSMDLKKPLDSSNISEAINCHVTLKKTLKNQKLSFKVAKGWTLQQFMVSGKTWQHYGPGDNGKKLTIKKGSEIDFLLTDPKGNDLWFYYFFD